MTVVNVADSAARKVCDLLDLEDDQTLKLRAYVTGGGCQGLQYGFAFESCAEPDDTEVFVSRPGVCVVSNMLLCFCSALRTLLTPGVRNASGFSVLIDPISLTYLRGAYIDYVMDAQGERFVVQNQMLKRPVDVLAPLFQVIN